jgi:uncharacterized membrane protein YhdT
MDDLLSLWQPESWSPFTAGLIAAMAFARGLDFLSTWLVTPRLHLEANPLMRRLRWVRMAALNLPLLGLPLLHHGLSITFVVTSLLAAGSNLVSGALARGMGERRQVENQRQAIREMGVIRALAMNSGGGLVTCAAGAMLMSLAGGAGNNSWWGGLGVVMFGVVGLVHFNLAILRLGKKS